MQIHYFLARDIIIDNSLYRACNSDAVRVCHGAQNWHQTQESPSNKLVFPCLVRNLYPEDEDEDEEDEFEDEKKDEEKEEGKLSEVCVEEVERTLRQRAMSVNLHPDIEEDCRGFLHTVCLAHVKPGEELGCLQEHLATLEPSCRDTVELYTKIEARNPYLHPVISKACANLIDRKCGLEAKAQDGGQVMECLVRHKLEHPPGSKGAMNNKVRGEHVEVSPLFYFMLMFQCRVVVEQWQILTLQDWRFSFKFKEACKGDIQDHCTNPRPKKKQDVIQCLVEAVATDTVEESKHRISKDCRSELKFEMLQKHSNIKLDPALEDACHEDLSKFCAHDRGEDGGIECLKSQKQKTLTKKCRKQLFKEEQEEANDNDVDFALVRGCKREIKEHCSGEDGRDILRCLKSFSHDFDFNQKCLDMLNKRIVQQSQDYRLNPNLKKNCRKDILKFCSSVINDHMDENGEAQAGLEGAVINCLKQTALQRHQLADTCMKEVVLTMVDAAQLVAADPVLERLCPVSLANCRSVHNSDGEINECIKGCITQ